ncbi:MAG TPA: pyridoxamine 5'-phosphate oxidase family protein [Actinomycetes bacterium]|nr:pyridoxamine 5'-phosphate oxidase family protein [Actinomycetes bacterium]
MENPNAARGGRDPATVAREIIDANRYLTLATADGGGRPWATPVWYAHQGYTDLYWVSRPGARHSRNLAVRPEVGIVIFDSTVREGDGQAVYVEALAAELDGAERDEGIAVFSRRSEAGGGAPWGVADVSGTATFRLYRARASAHFVLAESDERLTVRLD